MHILSSDSNSVLYFDYYEIFDRSRRSEFEKATPTTMLKKILLNLNKAIGNTQHFVVVSLFPFCCEYAISVMSLETKDLSGRFLTLLYGDDVTPYFVFHKTKRFRNALFFFSKLHFLCFAYCKVDSIHF